MSKSRKSRWYLRLLHLPYGKVNGKKCGKDDNTHHK